MNNILRQIKRKYKIEYILLTLILFVGFIVRLYRINNPIADWHSWRQADTASVSKVFVQRGINLLFPRYHDISSIQSGIFNPEGLRMVEFPLFNLVHALLAKTFPFLSLEVWGRLVSIFSGILSAYLIFQIGKRFISLWGGVLAAFFFTFIPFNIYFSRVILPEPFAQLFALLSLWFFVLYIDKDKTHFLYLSGISLSLSLLVKPFTFFYIIPMAYLIQEKHKFSEILQKSKLFINLLIFIDLVIVPFLLWRHWINKFPEGIPFFTWAFNGDRIRFRPAFWRWIFGERLGRLILGIWGLIPLSFGIITKKKSYFTLSFFAGALIYLTVFATASVRHDYYQIFVIPSISLLLAEGGLYLWKLKCLNLWLSRSLFIFSVILMMGMGTYQIKEFYKVNHPEIILAGQEVDRITPKDALVIAPYNGDTAFLYQTNRWGWPAIDDSIDNLIKRGASYYVSVDLGSADTKMLALRFETIVLDANYIIIDLHKLKKK